MPIDTNPRDTSEMVQVQPTVSDRVVSPAYPATPNAFLRSPLPEIGILHPDMLRQFYVYGMPQFRIPALPDSSNPSSSARTRTVSTSIVTRALAAGTAFNLITSGTNLSAQMVVGPGATMLFAGTGIIDATKWNGVPVAGTPPTLGKIPIGQADGSALWADPVVQGVYPDGSNVATPPVAVAPTHINPVYVGGKGIGDGNLHGLLTDNTGLLVAAGAAASGVAKSGNPVQVGWIFNTVQPTATTGQVIESQGTARGGLIVATGVDVFNVTVSAALPTGANVIGGVTQSGLFNVNQAIGVAGFGKVTDGINTAAVKASSTAALATDPALVVKLPGSTISSAPAQTAVGTTAVQVLTANTARREVIIKNTGITVIKLNLGAIAPTQTVYHISLGGDSVADNGLGGVYVSEIWNGAIQAISSAAGGTIVITELT